MGLHRYTKCEYLNFKWFVKRIFLRKSHLDKSISKFINTNLQKGSIILNIGAGYWTPYDKDIKKKSKKVYNIDTSFFANIFRLFNCKRIILDDKNVYELIKKYKIDTIVSFHSMSFIHIDLPKLIKFCVNKKIKFLFDWSVQSDALKVEDISKFCYGESKFEIFNLIETHNLNIEDIFLKRKVFSKEQIYEGGRYLVKTYSN